MMPVVVGNLMMGRCLGLAKIPYIGATSNKDRRIHFSKYCKKGYEVANPHRDMERSYADFKKIVASEGEGHPLIYTNDGHLELIYRYYDDMKKMFNLLLPSREVLAASLDKEKFIDLARKHQIPIAPTLKGEDLHAIDSIRFPVVLKPLRRDLWFRSEMNKEFNIEDYSKVIRIETREAFDRIARRCEEEGIEYVIQQYLYGPEANIISFHSFYGSDHRPLGYYVGRKIRTNPVRYGLSSSLKLVDYPEILPISLEIMEKLDFVGPIKIDFKLDEKSGELYVLEINTRYNMWHYLGARAGINLPAMAIRYLQGERFEAPLTEYRTDIRWISFFQEFAAFRELQRNDEITLTEWLSDFKGRRIYQTLAYDDPLPVAYAGYKTFVGALRRVRRIVK